MAEDTSILEKKRLLLEKKKQLLTKRQALNKKEANFSLFQGVGPNVDPLAESRVSPLDQVREGVKRASSDRGLAIPSINLGADIVQDSKNALTNFLDDVGAGTDVTLAPVRQGLSTLTSVGLDAAAGRNEQILPNALKTITGKRTNKVGDFIRASSLPDAEVGGVSVKETSAKLLDFVSEVSGISKATKLAKSLTGFDAKTVDFSKRINSFADDAIGKLQSSYDDFFKGAAGKTKVESSQVTRVVDDLTGALKREVKEGLDDVLKKEAQQAIDDIGQAVGTKNINKALGVGREGTGVTLKKVKDIQNIISKRMKSIWKKVGKGEPLTATEEKVMQTWDDLGRVIQNKLPKDLQGQYANLATNYREGIGAARVVKNATLNKAGKPGGTTGITAPFKNADDAGTRELFRQVRRTNKGAKSDPIKELEKFLNRRKLGRGALGLAGLGAGIPLITNLIGRAIGRNSGGGSGGDF
jgi:hypothetical protein